jgi:4a-hydroxytetrahydrobiopterin dehydratase
MQSLTQKEIEQALDELNGWTLEDDKIIRKFQFDNFKQAISFMVRVGFEAEAQKHHPEWTNVYNRVVVKLCTHDAGDKVTNKDIQLAKAIDKIYKTD